MLAAEPRRFRKVVEFEDPGEGEGLVVARLRPLGTTREVSIDPGRRFGAPVVRSTPTDVLAELFRAGESVERLAELYVLSVDQVLDALEYERQRAA